MTARRKAFKIHPRKKNYNSAYIVKYLIGIFGIIFGKR
jgi:hypothetical protein